MTCDQLVSTCVGWLDCEKLASTCVRISVLIKVSPLASPVQSSPLVSPSVQSFDQSLRVLDYSSLCLRKDLRVTGYKTYSISSKTCGRVFIVTSNFFSYLPTCHYLVALPGTVFGQLVPRNSQKTKQYHKPPNKIIYASSCMDQHATRTSWLVSIFPVDGVLSSFYSSLIFLFYSRGGNL